MTFRLLIVAGSDSGGGAGIQADIRTVTMFGGHAMTAITAVTAQNTLGVQAVAALAPSLVLEQIASVADDLGVDAVKIGMIGSAATARALADRLEAMSDVPIVFDPVMVATSGSVLADEETILAFTRLARIATVSTPNLPELARLIGRELTDRDALEEAAREWADRTGRAVLAKGGHLPDGPVLDLLVEDQAVRRWESERIHTRHSHGTGCTLASALACGLAAGRDMTDAVARARAYVQAALLAAPGLGAGHGPIGHTLGLVPVDYPHPSQRA